MQHEELLKQITKIEQALAEVVAVHKAQVSKRGGISLLSIPWPKLGLATGFLATIIGVGALASNGTLAAVEGNRKVEQLVPGLVMVSIPAGSFQMGDSTGHGGIFEKPVHRVSISSIKMSKTKVTDVQFKIFTDAIGVDFEGVLNNSDEYVTWNIAVAYTKWLSQQTGKRFRLPTEAEWEYAVRAGSTGDNYWGNSSDGSAYLTNGFGLYSMMAGSSEWVQDCKHEFYDGAPNDGSAWISRGECNKRGARGGSASYLGEHIRSATRGWGGLNGQLHQGAGIRLVQDNDCASCEKVLTGDLAGESLQLFNAASGMPNKKYNEDPILLEGTIDNLCMQIEGSSQASSLYNDVYRSIVASPIDPDSYWGMERCRVRRGKQRRAPFVHLCAEEPLTRLDYLKSFHHFLITEQHSKLKWADILNNMDEKGNTLLDYIKYLDDGQVYGDFEKNAVRKMIVYVCEGGGVYKKYPDAKCPN